MLIATSTVAVTLLAVLYVILLVSLGLTAIRNPSTPLSSMLEYGRVIGGRADQSRGS